MQASKKKRIGSLAAALVETVAALVLLAPAAAADSPQAYVYPLMGPQLSSNFGKRVHPRLRVVRHHHGVDLAAPSGAPIRAVKAGRVVFADPHGGYGNLVVIEHEDGLTSHYGHCATISAVLGRRVAAGEIIGTVGSTGISTGPHLHFEIRRGGKPQDPQRFIPGLTLEGEG